MIKADKLDEARR
jgi:DnaJ family protein C protein 2